MTATEAQNLVPSERDAYVLLTAAYNEEAFLEKTIQSVIAQTVPPRKWAIVSDGSTDRTDEIVRDYAAHHSFICFVRRDSRHVRNFGSKVHALNLGYQCVRETHFDFIGNLDADISLGTDYYQQLVERFHTDLRLGIAGGYVQEEYGSGFENRPFNTTRAVPHAVQFLRRECYEAIGGFTPLPYGGIDWCAEVQARMNGWRVESFQDLPVFHHRHTGTAGSILRARFRQGLMANSLGSHPVFELLRGLRRLREKPYVVGSLLRLTGYFWGICRGEVRPVSDTFVQFHRAEQLRRIGAMLSALAGRKRTNLG